MPRSSPFHQAVVSRRGLLFLVAAVLPFALVALQSTPMNPQPFAAASALMALVLVGVVVTPWARMPAWAFIAPPAAYLVIVALLRHSELGMSSVIAAMSLLPVIWVACWGDRTQLVVILLGVGAVFDIPVLIFDESRYASSDVVQGAVMMVVGAIVGFAIEWVLTGLRTIDAELSSTVSGALDGFASADACGRIVVWTPRSAEILGWTEAEVLGRDIAEIIPMLGGPSFFNGEHRNASGPAAMATSALHRNGWRVPVHVSVTVVVDRNRAERTNVFIQDSSDRKRVMDALIATENRFQTMFEHTPIGTALIGLDGTIAMANHAYCEVFGRPRNEVERFPVAALVHPDDAESVRLTLDAIVRGTTAHSHEERRRTLPDGSVGWVQVHKSLIRDADGNPEFVLAHVLDITDRRRFEQQLQHQANHDPLTGLLNRRGFGDELTRQVALVRRYGPSGALIMLDLDGFKYVNDTLGHSAGDELIVSVGRVLRSRLRETDVLARLGGDEFAIILTKVEHDAAMLVAGEIVEAVRSATFLEQPLLRPVTASVGVVMFDQSHLTADEMLMRADLAMYDAKERGKDQVSVYETPDSPEPRSKARMTWIDQLNDALTNERFVLEAQPIIDLRSGRITEYELLIRMQGAAGDLIPPSTFLYIAERYDLITDIDRWVAKQAIALLAERSDIPAGVGLTVNLSGKSVACELLATEIADEIARTGIDPRRLTFELTETAAVADVPAARRFAERLAALGCHFALDDFGAGFGSFYYLKHLPVDLIKIDGEFVRNCVRNRSDQLTIESVVHLARGLGKRTVAEFVTDTETCELLLALGVDQGQGFHIGRPQTLELPMDATHVWATAAA